MKLLKSSIHPNIDTLDGKSIFKRLSTRAIALKGEEILLLHTKRYEDYSFPGGGVNPGENILDALTRELNEETGAQNIRDIKPFGIYEEHRPWYKPEYDLVHMISYCYSCSVDSALGQTNYEQYEVDNGMKPLWINIFEAIEHNEKTLHSSDKKGLSLEREIFLLKLVAEKLLP